MVHAYESASSVKRASVIVWNRNLCIISAYHSKYLTLILIFKMALSEAYRCHLATPWGFFVVLLLGWLGFFVINTALSQCQH